MPIKGYVMPHRSKQRRIRSIRFLLFILLALLICLLYGTLDCQPAFAQDDLPATISIQIGIIDIPDVDERLETFDLDAYLTLQWQDSGSVAKLQAAGMVAEEGVYRFDSTTGALDALKRIGWANVLQFTNQVGEKKILAASLEVDSEGNTTYDERLQMTLHSPFFLDNFPFDTQTFTIDMETFNLDTQIAVLDITPEAVSFYREPLSTRGFELEEWTVKDDIMTTVGEYTSNLTGKTYSYAHVAIIAGRKTAFYIWKIFLPLILILGISWSVFWINRESVANRLSIASVAFLTAIAFGFYITNNLPAISYLTLMDMFIMGIYLLVILTVAEVIVTYSLLRRGKEHTADMMDRHARWIFPMLLVILVGILIWVY